MIEDEGVNGWARHRSTCVCVFSFLSPALTPPPTLITITILAPPHAIVTLLAHLNEELIRLG
jgi:hypothetical protein